MQNFKSPFVTTCYPYHVARHSTYVLLRPEHNGQLNELKKDADIMLSRPDNGAGMVILDKFVYFVGMGIILNDKK